MLATHDKISPTAKLVAYLRTFSDIPFSKEISNACNAEETYKELTGDLGAQILSAAPRVEARYKSLDALLAKSGCYNILELAAGVSPRAVLWSEDPRISYVVTDLPEILEENRQLSREIFGSVVNRRNLHWCPVNATSRAQMDDIDLVQKKGPVAVIHEGLLPYLNHLEKKSVAVNILDLLSTHGGVWITPDIISREQFKALSDPAMLKMRESISGLTERDLDANAFSTLEEGEKFFEDLGFVVRRFNQTDLIPNPLSSVAATGSDPNKIAKTLEVSKIWTLKVR